MRDLHLVNGKKYSVDTLEGAAYIVGTKYSGASKHYSGAGAWHFRCGGKPIAEAWLKMGSTYGWWLRIAEE